MSVESLFLMGRKSVKLWSLVSIEIKDRQHRGSHFGMLHMYR